MSGATVVQTTTSAADGTYSFLARPGQYTVQEVPPSGWRQTAPVTTQLQFTPAFTPLGVLPYAIATGDFDGDGRLDYVVTNPYNRSLPDLYILYGNGDGTFSNGDSPAGIALNKADQSSYAVSVVPLAMDLGGQNLPDLAVVLNDSQVLFLRNGGGRGPGQFTGVSGLGFARPGAHPMQMIVGDFTGHGAQDLAISYAQYDVSTNATIYGVLVWVAATNQVYDQPFTIMRSGGPVASTNIASADINGDGFRDIVLVGGNTPSDLSIIYGDGAWVPNRPLPVQTITLKNVNPNSLALGDINGDGAPDVLVSGSFPTNAAAYAEYILNSGGKFSEDSTSAQALAIPQQFPNGDLGDVTLPLLADVNGDGLLDVVLASNNTLSAPLTIFTNSGRNALGAQFNAAVQVFLNNGYNAEAGAIAVADLDGDGFNDLIVADAGDKGVTILNNRTVITPRTFPVQVAPDVDSTGNTFINAQLGQVSGTVYRDANRTGTREPGEPGVAGVTLYIDLNGNGAYDPSEPTATTNADGLYAFDGLPAGRHEVRIVPARGDLITTPGPGSHAVVIAPGGTNPARDFGTDASLLATLLQEAPAAPGGQPISFQVQPSAAAAGRPLRFTLQPGAPAGATVDARTGLVTWTPPAGQAPGTYVIGVRIYDTRTPRVSEVKTVAVTVLPTFAAPIVPPIADVAVDESGRLSLAVAASDPSTPAGALIFSLAGAPAGATIDPATGLISWVAAAPPGTYTFVVTVANGARPELATSTAFGVTLRNVAPAIAPLDAITLPAGADLSAVGSFADPGLGPWAATVDYGDGSGPMPLAIGADKTFRLSHRYANPGLYAATVVVRDASGGVASTIVGVFIAPPPAPPGGGPVVDGGPPALGRFVVADGGPQRSVIKTLTLDFVGPVSIAPGAIRLLGPGKRRISLTILVTTAADGHTVATIGFAGPGTRNGALANGRYRLVLRAGGVTDPSGRTLAGGDRVLKFHRLKGDLNGDGRVDRREARAVKPVAKRVQRAAVPAGPMATRRR